MNRNKPKMIEMDKNRLKWTKRTEMDQINQIDQTSKSNGPKCYAGGSTKP